MDNKTKALPGKRLIVTCDGTWLDSDNGFERDSYLPWKANGSLQVPSNVTRFERALKSESAEGIPQIVYYQAGIGSANNWYSHLVEGATGGGISENIREAYAFLAANYQEGDEIFLIGFSRGAFTARSIAGLIASVGLLTRHGMTDFYQVFKDWENQDVDGYVTKWPKQSSQKVPITDPKYAQELERRGVLRLNITIRGVGVWDTVGSLGIPNLGLLAGVKAEYAFVNTAVSPNIEHAFQALALDEHRSSFSPTIWETPLAPNRLKSLKQCWFPGVHSNIGGSYPDTEISDLTLAWMISQFTDYGLLDFDTEYITLQHELNKEYYREHSQKVREWGMGEIYNSMVGLVRLGGEVIRTPGRYCATDPKTGKTTERRLRDTNERVHACVRVRMAMRGLGTQDKGLYNPTALKGWKLIKGAEGRFRWELRGQKGKEQSGEVLIEDELGEVERMLLSGEKEELVRKVAEGQVGLTRSFD